MRVRMFAFAACSVATIVSSVGLAEDKPAEVLKEADTSFWSGWKRSAEVGINGSAGNSENFNIRAGLGTERKTDKLETTAGIKYSYATSDGQRSANRGEAFGRNDWILSDPRWRVFAKGGLEYDEFQDWKWRINGAAGIGYAFVQTEKFEWIGRVGPAFNWTLQGHDPNPKLTPEIDIGTDVMWKITERQKITASADYYPALDDFPSSYRFVAKAAYEVLVDPETNMSLKLGAEDRYQSEPGGGRKKNDIDYFLLLLWKF